MVGTHLIFQIIGYSLKYYLNSKILLIDDITELMNVTMNNEYLIVKMSAITDPFYFNF